MVAVVKKGKTVEEAIEAALVELATSRDKVDVEIIEEAKKSLFGMFGGRQAMVRVTFKEEVVEPVVEAAEEMPVTEPQVAPQEEVAVALVAAVAEEKIEKAAFSNKVSAEKNAEDAVAAAKVFLQSIFKAMKMKVVMEKFYNRDEEATIIKLHGPGMGVLIGKHGQTLDALQYLTNLVANKHSQERVRIVVDVEDYRERRKETLVRLTQRLAEKVRRTGDKIVLEPMNPYERKIIHTTLQNDKKLTTYSEGEEPYRKTIIALKNH